MLEVTERHIGGILVLELTGRVDLAAARDLDTRLGALPHTTATRVVLDLAQLTYLSSLGLRAILMAAKAAHAARGKLVLCSPNAEIKRLFDVAFANVFEIYPSREAALAAL